MPAKNDPKPTAATSARSTADRLFRRVCASAAPVSRAASMTPISASAMPATCTARGRSPETSPTSTGTAAPVAETGATMLIVPIASAR